MNINYNIYIIFSKHAFIYHAKFFQTCEFLRSLYHFLANKGSRLNTLNNNNYL